MNRIRNDYTILSIIGAIVILGIAWIHDAASRFYNLNNMELYLLNFISLWVYPLIALLLAAALLILAWFVLIYAPRNIWTSLLFLITGLFIRFYLAIYLTPPLGLWLPSIDILLNTTISYLSSSSSFIAMIGLFAIILPKKIVCGCG